MSRPLVSRKDAISKGADRYFTGKPCKRGHVSERITASRDCVDCKKTYMREYLRFKRATDEDFLDRERERNRRHNKRRWKNPDYRNREIQRMREKIKTDEYREKRSEYVSSEKFKSYRRDRYANDVDYKMSVIARSMVSRAIQLVGSEREERSLDANGYSPAELREHLESMFLDGMTWGNYGEWHIDHKKPVSRMVKDGASKISEINHLSNLIPMWAEHNLDKKDRTLDEWLSDNPGMKHLYGHFS